MAKPKPKKNPVVKKKPSKSVGHRSNTKKQIAKGKKNAEKILVNKVSPQDALQNSILNVVKEGNESIGKHRAGEINRTTIYLIGLLQGKNKKTAALDAGFSPSTANNPAHIIESTDQFKNAKEAFSTEMIAQGITIESITGALAEMLERRSSTFCWGKEQKGTQIDPTSAKMAIDSISKILGLNAPEKKLVVVADLRDVQELTNAELDEELRNMIQK